MSKKKRERLESDYIRDLTPDAQRAQLDRIFELQQAMASGLPISKERIESVMNVRDRDPSDMITESSMFEDALNRHFQKNQTSPTGEPYKIPSPSHNTVRELNAVSRIHESESDFTRARRPMADDNGEAVLTATPARMLPSGSIRPLNDEIANDDDDVETQIDDTTELATLDDCPLLFYDPEDSVLTVQNPLDVNRGNSIHLFCLRGYNLEYDSNYETLKEYISVMLAMIAGPLIVVPEDAEAFAIIYRSATHGTFDSSKFPIFYREIAGKKYFIIYAVDKTSYMMMYDDILPALEAEHESIDFVTVLLDLVLNPFINPYSCNAVEWVDDYIEEYQASSPDDIADVCDMICREENLYSSNCMTNTLSHFVEKICLGEITEMMTYLRKYKEALISRMTPDTYVETFLEDRSHVIEEFEDTIPEESYEKSSVTVKTGDTTSIGAQICDGPDGRTVSIQRTIVEESVTTTSEAYTALDVAQGVEAVDDIDLENSDVMIHSTQTEFVQSPKGSGFLINPVGP